VQSGEPYSLYEFYGAVGSAYAGTSKSVEPRAPDQESGNPESVFTGNKGSFRAPGGNYIPTLDPSQIAINYLAPGEKGVPTAAQEIPGSVGHLRDGLCPW